MYLNALELSTWVGLLGSLTGFCHFNGYPWWPLLLLNVVWLLRLRVVSKDEQLFISLATDVEVVNGPQWVILPLVIRGSQIQKAMTLGSLEFCVVNNSLTGERKVEVGPKLLFLAAYEKTETVQQTVSLKATEFIRYLDKSTGKVRVEKGQQGKVVPGPYEVPLDKQGKREAIHLKVFEYVRIEDRKSGEVRVERGEKLVFLEGFEEVMDGGKQTAIEVDEKTAVLVRNKRDGQQRLVTKRELFVPTNEEEIVEIRDKVKLADYEACIVRDSGGNDTFYFGSNPEQKSFFLPPNAELVKLVWSRGRRREKRDLVITKIDLRPVYMSFEFNCRTADNVELILEGSFFWEVVDLKAMVKFTGDTSGDVCNHARSKFIELVSRVKLQQFMSDFNMIAEQVHKSDDEFYRQRGVLIHSLEVTGYQCAEDATAKVLRQIIMETTNRMNRLQQQESENEVQLKQIRGDIDEEMARQELLKIQTDNNTARARMEGLAEAEKLASFMEGLKEDVPDVAERVRMWNVLRKGEVLDALSRGSAQLYFTPSDVSLSLESHKHTH